jgi:hypothetical protein
MAWAIFILCPLSFAAQANQVQRMHFATGASSATVNGSIRGKQYVERERMPGDKAPAGRKYLTGELTFDKGNPLEPGK